MSSSLLPPIAIPPAVLQEACQKAVAAKSRYVRLLRNSKKRGSSLAILREEALKHIPDFYHTPNNIQAVESFLMKVRL